MAVEAIEGRRRLPMAVRAAYQAHGTIEAVDCAAPHLIGVAVNQWRHCCFDSGFGVGFNLPLRRAALLGDHRGSMRRHSRRQARFPSTLPAPPCPITTVGSGSSASGSGCGVRQPRSSQIKAPAVEASAAADEPWRPPPSRRLQHSPNRCRIAEHRQQRRVGVGLLVLGRAGSMLWEYACRRPHVMHAAKRLRCRSPALPAACVATWRTCRGVACV